MLLKWQPGLSSDMMDHLLFENHTFTYKTFYWKSSEPIIKIAFKDIKVVGFNIKH